MPDCFFLSDRFLAEDCCGVRAEEEGEGSAEEETSSSKIEGPSMRLERRLTSCLRASREPVSESERVVFSAAGSAGFFLFQNQWVEGVVEKDLVDEGVRVSAWRAGRSAVDGGMAAGAT